MWHSDLPEGSHPGARPCQHMTAPGRPKRWPRTGVVPVRGHRSPRCWTQSSGIPTRAVRLGGFAPASACQYETRLRPEVNDCDKQKEETGAPFHSGRKGHHSDGRCPVLGRNAGASRALGGKTKGPAVAIGGREAACRDWTGDKTRICQGISPAIRKGFWGCWPAN